MMYRAPGGYNRSTTVNIPDVETLHERSFWEEVGYRMVGDFDRNPPSQRPTEITTGICHYTSAINLPDGDPGESWMDIKQKLRDTQRDYLTNRVGGGYTRLSDNRFFPGYSVGYLFAVDWLGGAWELRGFEFMSAANSQDNTWTAPILFITDGQDPGTEAQWATARAIWREFRRRSGRNDFAASAVGHDDLPHGNTSCPGAGLFSQLHAGLGELDRDSQSGDAMQPIATGPERAYDSRRTDQTTQYLADLNAGVPMGPMVAGEERRIVVGQSCVSAEVHVTVVGGTDGYVTVSGFSAFTRRADVNTTSLVNVNGSGVEQGTGGFATPESAIFVRTAQPIDGLIVDVFQRG